LVRNTRVESSAAVRQAAGHEAVLTRERE